jgi:hypothetical protein
MVGLAVQRLLSDLGRRDGGHRAAVVVVGMSTKVIGWRTPSRVVPQPNVTISHEDDATWHWRDGSPGWPHLEDFVPIEEPSGLWAEALEGLWMCRGCGLVVEPIYAVDEVLAVWRELVDVVTEQDDWDDEDADGPEDIYRYVERLLSTQCGDER